MATLISNYIEHLKCSEAVIRGVLRGCFGCAAVLRRSHCLLAFIGLCLK